MRGICLVMLLLVCANAKAAGDRSGIEPVGKSTASFLPPITPPLSGSPGNNQYLQSNGSGVSCGRTVGFDIDKPAGSVRAVVPERVSVSPGSVRVLQLVFPMSGPYKGRVSNFDW